MKFAWKVFYCTVTIFALSFACLGYLLIQKAFSDTLERDVRNALEDNALSQNTFTAMATSYHLNGMHVTDEVVEQIVDRLNVPVAICDPAFQTVVQKLPHIVDEQLIRQWESDQIYRIVHDNGNYYIQVASQVDLDERELFLLTENDLTPLFLQRNGQLALYRRITAIAVSAAAVLLLLISFGLTRSVRKLDQAAKEIASGAYHKRVQVMGNDELATLSHSFDTMTSALQERILELDRVARQREDFVAAFAHELKTPLTSIIGYSDMLRSHLLGADQVFMAANTIYQEGRRLEALSLKLLDLMVLERQDFPMKRINPRILLEEMQTVLGITWQQSGIVLMVDAEDSSVEAEPDLLKTLLINLLDNAKKASSAGHGVWLTGTNQDDSYAIKVEDHGKGIPPEEISRITEAFYMLDKSRSEHRNSVGLGLNISDRIAILHNTRLVFESTPGQGTTVSFCLKRVYGEPQ